MSQRVPICPIENLPSVATYIMGLFIADKTAIIAYDAAFIDPFIANFGTLIGTVEGILNPQTIIKQMVDNNVLRNSSMGKMSTFISDGEYAVKKCIKAGTITGTLKSFNFSALKTAILNEDIIGLNTAYQITILKLTANSAALIAVGFLAAKTTAITTNFNLAWGYHNTNLTLETTKKNLVINNMTTIMQLSDACSAIVNVGQAWASSFPVNSEKKKIYIMNGILRTVIPHVASKPRKRHLKPTQTIIYQSNIPANHTMQFTLLTEEPIQLGRSVTKSGVPTETVDLPQGLLTHLTKDEIPGTGEYVKMLNMNLKKAVVEVFIIKPS
jgi:hypothetical protein